MPSRVEAAAAQSDPDEQDAHATSSIVWVRPVKSLVVKHPPTIADYFELRMGTTLSANVSVMKHVVDDPMVGVVTETLRASQM